MTKSKEDMIESTRSELERYLQEYVIVVDEVDREARSEIVSLPEIGMRYHDRTGNRTNTTAVGNALRKMGYNVAKRPTLSNKQRLTLRAVGRPDYWAKQSEEAWKVEFERLRLRPIG